MRIYVARHAWADEPDAMNYPDDRLRPLTDTGRKRYRQMLEVLARRDFAPEVIASSPLVRCQQTAELMASIVRTHPDVHLLPALEPGSDLEPLLEFSNQQQADRVAWVGHAPDVGWLVAALCGGPDTAIQFAKGAIAEVRFDGPAIPTAGRLHWFATAKLLGC